jgi:hypothetical protein
MENRQSGKIKRKLTFSNRLSTEEAQHVEKKKRDAIKEVFK